MKNLRLSKEYLAPPVFCADADNMGHCDLDDLPISDELRSELKSWDFEYQITFNSEYPPDSGFKSPETKKAHEEKGAKLAEKLRIELGSGCKVEYQT